jgi:hypothetical protein
MTMRLTAAVALIALAVCWSGVAGAYEFKLLNGMKVEGALKSFEDGRFLVETKVGPMSIDADKLDYIVVEASDPGPCTTTTEQGAPGQGLCHMPPPNVKGLGKVDTSEGEAAAPQPLAGHSIAPAPLMGHSVMPAPLGTFSVNAAKAYPGLFKGAAE